MKLYTTSQETATWEINHNQHWQTKLSNEEKDSISHMVTDEEIRTALWSLKAFKAPGLDGLHTGFFQRFWLTVGGSVREEVHSVFREKKIPDYLNRTSIVLILEIQGPETIGNFRPISLCNVVYKIVSKIIVGRIRPFLDQLISPCQAAFVPGRRGVDNAIIVQELIHTMGKARGKCGYMALKIDLEKAYNKLEWSFIKVLFAKANVENCIAIREVLDTFCNFSGQTVSEANFRVYFSPNVDQDNKEALSDILGFHQTEFLGKYLGFPIKHRGDSNQGFGFVLDRVKSKLAGWKASLLSIAGREVLIQASSSAIPAYVMQSNLLPNKVLEGIDRVNRNFLWGSVENKRKMHWVGWNKVTKLKEEGGLGLQTAKGRNTTLLTKLNWRFHTEDKAPWAKVLRLKYCNHQRLNSRNVDKLPSSRT
ncbi:hypothetical protein SO802_000466 [Lithocarpus litseifolius]|uniref:Reverse transcriptase domain-containing protein n=1 Tax=Lithocarpus litseifolius TaxID=425828 RepID=A0AAW2DUD0_9ROSI